MSADGYDVEIEPDVDPAVAAAAARAATELAAEDRLGEPRGYRTAWRRTALRELTDDRMER